MRILSFISILFAFFLLADSAFAALNCSKPPDSDTIECKFGTISPPPALQKFIGTDPTGAGAISQFLSNLVILIYSAAAIVLIFMILWGAFEWLTSGGDKEAIAKARSRILNAFIGIILFAIAFAVIRVLGQFTGFQFFKTNITILRDSGGTIYKVICPDGYEYGGPGARINNPSEVCKDQKTIWVNKSASAGIC